jgi:hypothetical protein
LPIAYSAGPGSYGTHDWHWHSSDILLVPNIENELFVFGLYQFITSKLTLSAKFVIKCKIRFSSAEYE